MELDHIVLEDDRRCSAGDLKTILKALPIKFSGDFEIIKAVMELGRIIYFIPVNGKISEIDYGKGIRIQDVQDTKKGTRFYYCNNNFSVYYKS
ncbi:hypothetical protein J4230_02350 [Candidatus Woesearchaeota archaeon]|nr:hypothetical protein [Candidatus Woesearchaeota archaeon]